jgi:hypothetical protein
MLIVVPDAGAAELKVTTPVAPIPPTMVLGPTLNLVRTGASSVIVVELVPAPMLAVMVTTSVLATGLDVRVNVAVVAPLATVTVAGTWASVLLLARLTTTPVGPAA